MYNLLKIGVFSRKFDKWLKVLLNIKLSEYLFSLTLVFCSKWPYLGQFGNHQSWVLPFSSWYFDSVAWIEVHFPSFDHNNFRYFKISILWYLKHCILFLLCNRSHFQIPGLYNFEVFMQILKYLNCFMTEMKGNRSQVMPVKIPFNELFFLDLVICKDFNEPFLNAIPT